MNTQSIKKTAVELIRADLEFSYADQAPRTLQYYHVEFPEVLGDRQSLAEVAFEEYRMRYLAGNSPTTAEYESRYGVCTADWPVWSDRDSAPSRQPQGQFLEPGSRFANFELFSELGRGAFARVYLARQRDLAHRFVALKITVNSCPEPQRLAELQHTNIVPVYSLHREDPLQAVCMPFLGSTTLADVLRHFRQRGGIPSFGRDLASTVVDHRESTINAAIARQHSESAGGPDDVPGAALQKTASGPLHLLAEMSYPDAIVWLAGRIAGGLAHAHERGVVHRDLKPANVLISDDGEPLILDFNLSASVTAGNGDAAMVGGTLPYMAPEQIRHLQTGGSADPRSDVYSLGVVLFELLAGKTPFPPRYGSFPEVIREMERDRRHPAPCVRTINPDVSADVAAIVAHCLKADPKKRYASAAQLHVDLERHLQHLPPNFTRGGSLAERTRKWARRHPRLSSGSAVAITCLALLCMLSLAYMVRNRQVAKLRAFDAVDRFATRLAGLRDPFLAPHIDLASLTEALQAGEQLLEEHRELDVARHRERPPFTLLHARQQQSYRQHVTELRFLLATGALRASQFTSDADRRDEFIASAARFNQQAFEALDPPPSALLHQRARIVESRGQSETAKEMRKQANRAAVASKFDRYLLAMEPDFGQALPAGDDRDSLLEQLAGESPQQYVSWLMLGHNHVLRRRHTQADACYTTCIALAPDSYSAWLCRGAARLEMGRYEAARSDFDRALRLDPSSPAALFNRALAQKDLGHPREALDDMTAALNLGATETRIYFARARLRTQLGDRPGAAEDWRRGLELTPSDATSWIARGVAQLRQAPEAALADFRRAAELNPRSVEAWNNIASVLAEQIGDTQRAVEAMDRVVELTPQNSTAVATRGVLLARLGRRDAAHRDAQTALSLSRSADTLYRVSGIYAQTAREEPADSKTAVRLLCDASWKEPELVSRYLPKDPDLKPLSSQDEFQRVIRRLNQLRQLTQTPLTTGEAESPAGGQ